MFQNSLRHYLLKESGKSYGPMVCSDSTVVTEILASVGYGHIIIDHEHSTTDIQSGCELLRTIDSCRGSRHRRHDSYNQQQQQQQLKPPTVVNHTDEHKKMLNHHLYDRDTEAIVRLPGPQDIVYMKKVLDTMRLPGGVLIPMIEDLESAQRIVASTRYPQHQQQQQQTQQLTNLGNNNNHQRGTRGCAVPFIRSNHYGVHENNIDEYIKHCNEDLLVLIQIESVQGIEIIPDIAELDGVDGIFLGPFDLSASINRMGQFHHPEVQEIIRYAEEKVLQYQQKQQQQQESSSSLLSPCILAGFKSPHDDLHTMFHVKNYSLVCGNVDIGLLRTAAQQDVQKGLDAIR